MANIKKAYQAIVDLLEANLNSKVKTILPAVIELATAKTGGKATTTFIKDADGKVIAVFCYYHKRWELVAAVEFGKKATSATGLSNMCKEGTSAWTKQQATAKKANAKLLVDVGAGDVAPGDIAKVQADIEAARGVVVVREDKHGFETEEAAIEAFKALPIAEDKAEAVE